MSDKIIKNIAVTSGYLNPVQTNNPSQYSNRQRQYYDPETRLFIEQNAKYASDFVEAQIQALFSDDLTDWKTYRLRFTDVVRPSSAIQRHFDDYKQILFESRKVEYVRPGTKIVTMGNTWLVTNPINISGASGGAVIRRCNAVWNHLDYYGNVVSEPIIVENERANANASDNEQGQNITKGYFNVICQYNDATRQIDTNTRMILGTGAYRVTGYSDFETEFTGDYSTVRMLSFTVRYEEPNLAIDDMANHVAGGKNFTWDISLSAARNMRVGNTTRFIATSKRNGDITTSTAEYPIAYLWESSNEDVATVDAEGNVTAIAEGEAIISATLSENPAFSASTTVTVTQSEDGVFFTSAIPEKMNPYELVTITAAYFEDGLETEEALNWSFSGADSSAYIATASQDGRSATISCYGYSDAPLLIIASYGAYTAAAGIVLEGI